MHVWYGTTLHFGLRPQELQGKLRKSDLGFREDETGESVALSIDFCSKNCQGGAGDVSLKQSADPNIHSKVVAVQLRLSLKKLNPNCDCLFQRARAGTVKETDSTWFVRMSLGKNLLGSMIQLIFDRAKLSGGTRIIVSGRRLSLCWKHKEWKTKLFASSRVIIESRVWTATVVTKPCAAERQVADYFVGVTGAENQVASNVPMKFTTDQGAFLWLQLLILSSTVWALLTVVMKARRRGSSTCVTKPAKRSKLARQAEEFASKELDCSSLSFES